MNGSINQEIAELIQHEAVSRNVTVVVTAIAQKVAEELLKQDPSYRKTKRPASSSKLLMSLKTKLLSGSWRGILLERGGPDDDWYSATVAIRAEEVWDKAKHYGPLYLTDDCPQPLESRSEGKPTRIRSLLQRLFGSSYPPSH